MERLQHIVIFQVINITNLGHLGHLFQRRLEAGLTTEGVDLNSTMSTHIRPACGFTRVNPQWRSIALFAERIRSSCLDAATESNTDAADWLAHERLATMDIRHGERKHVKAWRALPLSLPLPLRVQANFCLQLKLRTKSTKIRAKKSINI